MTLMSNCVIGYGTFVNYSDFREPTTEEILSDSWVKNSKSKDTYIESFKNDPIEWWSEDPNVSVIERYNELDAFIGDIFFQDDWSGDIEKFVISGIRKNEIVDNINNTLENKITIDDCEYHIFTYEV